MVIKMDNLRDNVIKFRINTNEFCFINKSL